MRAVDRARLRRRRGGQEGAALVEAVVVIPFFLIMFACVLFIGQSYSAKHGVMRESREKVWTYASSNCGESGDSTGGGGGLNGVDVGGIANGASDNGGNGGADTSSASHASGAPHSSVINKDVGSGAATSTTTVTSSGFLGSLTAKQSAYRKVMCNEPPYDGDVGGAMKSAWHDITGW